MMMQPMPEPMTRIATTSPRPFEPTSQPQVVNRWLWLILLGYALLATTYSVVTPLWEASDELWHYPMVKYLAEHRLQLPIQNPAETTPWRQEGSQPPLYYMLSAALTFWIDTSDFERVQVLNPHADMGQVVPDGNVNIAMHNPAIEAFPWQGTVLAVHLVRLFSVFLGGVTVLMGFRLAQELFPKQPAVWYAATLFTAFNPMFLFISGSVNNDNLSTALAAILLVAIVRLLKRTTAPTIPMLIGIGIAAGAGMLAKFNIGFLLPIIALALGIVALRLRSWRTFLVGAVITGGLTVAIGGWWYVRNWSLYGDPTGLNVFLDIVGRRAIPANAAQLWSERHTFLMSYWGFFGGVNVPLPTWIYTVCNGLAAIALVGLVGALILTVIGRFNPRRTNRETSNLVEQWQVWVGQGLTLIWIAVIGVGLIRWTSETWASQGRLAFAAITAISLWLAVGLWNIGRVFGRRAGGIILSAAAVWFVAIALGAAVQIRATYDDPYAPVLGFSNGAATSAPAQLTGATLLGSFIQPDRPEGARLAIYDQAGAESYAVQFATRRSVDLTFATENLPAGFVRNWSLAVQIETPEGVLVGQRDMYLGQGLWATSQLASLVVQQRSIAQPWRNRVAVPLTAWNVPGPSDQPIQLRAYLVFYHRPTGDRLIFRPAQDGIRADKDNRLLLADFTLDPAIQQKQPINFGDEAELINYDVSSLLVNRGQPVSVTLYWRARRPITKDYRVFVQIVKPNSTTVLVNSDGMPADWTRPTSSWQVGELIVDRRTFTIPAEAAQGDNNWTLAVGMYALRETPDGPKFDRLRVIEPDGSQANDFVYLARVRVAD